MKPFEKVSSIPTHLDKVNVDTDQIVPKQFLKLITKTGFGKFLFYNWRFDADGKPNPDFVLNNRRLADSKILITGDNFGCGSSREHAVWALLDYGFRVVIAPCFADIFYSNCFKNGLLPIRLDPKAVTDLAKTTANNEGRPMMLEVDLQSQTIKTPHQVISFEIDKNHKKILLQGLDEITFTLQEKYEQKISQYEKKSTVPSVL